MRFVPLVFLGLATLYGCNGGAGTGTVPPDRGWEGELRIIPGDSSYKPCGSHSTYRITGPGLDSLAHRYAWLRTVPGQWIKAWCSGHLVAGTAGGDSLLVATRYMHMDGMVHCPLEPVGALAGTYVRSTGSRSGPGSEQLLLFPNGDAMRLAMSLEGMPLETDGHWGVDNDGHVNFTSLAPQFTQRYAPEGGHLYRLLPDGSKGVAFEQEGPADRLAGTFGRAARWLAAVAEAHGQHLDPADIRPSMPIDSLIPDPTARAALKASARDSLGLTAEQLEVLWPPVENVREFTQLMRKHLREAR